MFVAEKAYICNMRRWCIKILLIAVLSLVSVFLYEVLWVLVDLDVRRDFINNGIPLDELFSTCVCAPCLRFCRWAIAI